MAEQNPTNPTSTNPPAAPQQQPAAGAGSPAGSPDAIISALMTALESRQQRVERSITRSMASQYSMSEDELTTLLNNHRAEKAKQLSPEAQRQLDAANARVQALMLQQNNILRAMSILKQISVRGDDTARMVVAMHLLRQVHGEMNKPHNPPPSKKEGALTE